MRLLVLTHHAVKNVYGEYEYNMCKHLEEKGIEVHDVALFGDNSHYCRNARIAKKPFRFLPSRIAKRIGEIFSPDMISEIKKNYDVVHVHAAFWSFIPLQVIIWKKILGIYTPVIMTTHQYLPEKQKMFGEALKEAVSKRNLSILFYGLRCLPYRRLDKVLCQSELERDFVIKQFKIDKKKVVTIPNGVDMRRYDIPVYNFKEKHSLKRKFMILFVGQLIKSKGVSYLLQALKIAKQRGLDCDLVLVSYNPKDDLINEAKALGIEDNLRIFVKLPEKDLISAYKNCDIFVLPSFQEGLPTVLLEAMAAKKPVVTTNVSGIPYLIKDGFNGMMVNPRDSVALATKIEKLLKNEKLAREIAENGYQTVLSEYTWDVVARKIIEQYDLVKERKR